MSRQSDNQSKQVRIGVCYLHELKLKAAIRHTSMRDLLEKQLDIFFELDEAERIANATED